MDKVLLIDFFGWAALLNIIILCFYSALLCFAKAKVVSIHNALFGLDEVTLTKAYFVFLAQYKILTVVFFIVPYVALKLCL